MTQFKKKHVSRLKKISPESGIFLKIAKNGMIFHNFQIQKIPKNSICQIIICYLHNLLRNYLTNVWAMFDISIFIS